MPKVVWQSAACCACFIVACSSCVCWCCSNVWLVGGWGLALLAAAAAAGLATTAVLTSLLDHDAFTQHSALPSVLVWLQKQCGLYPSPRTTPPLLHHVQSIGDLNSSHSAKKRTTGVRSMHSTHRSNICLPKDRNTESPEDYKESHTARASSASETLSDASALSEFDDSDDGVVLAELLLLAQVLHSKLVLPWYSQISPDGHSHQQVLGVLEDVLVSCWQRLQCGGGAKPLLLDACLLFARHTQHCASPTMESNGAQQCHGNELSHEEYEELCSMSQLLLLRHLPTSLLSCQALIVLLRDLLTRNVFIPLYRCLSQPCSLLHALALLLSYQPLALPPETGTESDATNVPEGDGCSGYKTVMSSPEAVFLQKLALVAEQSGTRVPSCAELAAGGGGGGLVWTLSAFSSDVGLLAGQKTVPATLVKELIATTVHKSTSTADIAKRKLDKQKVTFLNNKKWKKNPFSRGIVDGIREEDYTGCIKLSSHSVAPFHVCADGSRMFLSRPNSPVQCAEDALVAGGGVLGELQRSKSWTSVAWGGKAAWGERLGGVGSDSVDHTSVAKRPSVELLAGKVNEKRLPAEFSRRKRKLVKMNSFDNNDGSADTFLDINSMTGKGVEGFRSASDDIINYETVTSYNDWKVIKAVTRNYMKCTNLSSVKTTMLEKESSPEYDDFGKRFARDINCKNKKRKVSLNTKACVDSSLTALTNNQYLDSQPGSLRGRAFRSLDDRPDACLGETRPSACPNDALSVSSAQPVPCPKSSMIVAAAISRNNDSQHSQPSTLIPSFRKPNLNGTRILSSEQSTLVSQASSKFSPPLETHPVLTSATSSSFSVTPSGEPLLKQSSSHEQSSFECVTISAALQTSKSCHNLSSSRGTETLQDLGQMHESFSADDVSSVSASYSSSSNGKLFSSKITSSASAPSSDSATAALEEAEPDNEDLSPIYEECDTLESSIAKLRSLLSERDSQQSLGSVSSVGSSDSEPRSAHSDPGGRGALHDALRFSFLSTNRYAPTAALKRAALLRSSSTNKRAETAPFDGDAVHQGAEGASSANAESGCRHSCEVAGSSSECGLGYLDDGLYALEAPEVPLDDRLIVSCCLPETQVRSDSSGALYTVYTVQYDAIYLTDAAAGAKDSSQTENACNNDSSPEHENYQNIEADHEVSKEGATADVGLEEKSNADQIKFQEADVTCDTDRQYPKKVVIHESSSDAVSSAVDVMALSKASKGCERLVPKEPRMVLRTSSITRRFREFMMLHRALSSHPLLRHSLRGITGPNKWRHLPLTKLDDATVSARKVFLENYLQSLLLKVEINSSVIMQEFLAYNSECTRSCARRPLDVRQPRLDKLLGRTVSGVFHSLRATVPIAEGEVAADKLEPEPEISSRVPLPSPSCSEVPPSLLSSSFVTSSLTERLMSPSGGEPLVLECRPSYASPPSSPSTPPSPPLLPRADSEWVDADGDPHHQEHNYELQIAITAEMRPCAMEEALFCGLQSNESATHPRWKGYILLPKPHHDLGSNDPAQHGNRNIHMRRPAGHTRPIDGGQPRRRQRYDSSSAAARRLSGDDSQHGTSVGTGVEDVLPERSSPSKSPPSRPRFEQCVPSCVGKPVQINASSPSDIVSTSAWEEGPTPRYESYLDAYWKNEPSIDSSSGDYFRSVAPSVQSASVPRGGVRASTAAVLHPTSMTKEETSARTLAAIEISQTNMFSHPAVLGSSDNCRLLDAETLIKCPHSSRDDYESHHREAESDPVPLLGEALSDGVQIHQADRDVHAATEGRGARNNSVPSPPASTFPDPTRQKSDVQVLSILNYGVDVPDNSRTDAGSDLYRKPFPKTSNSYPSLVDFFQSRKKHENKPPKDLNLSFLQSSLDGTVTDCLSAPQTGAVSSTRLVLTSASNTPDSECLDAGSLTSSEAESLQASSCGHSCVSPRDTQPYSSCGSCWGSAVPPVTLPRPPPVSDYCCCPSPCPDTETCRRIEEGSRYPLAAALVDACVSLLEAPCCSQHVGAGSDSANSVSDVTITEPMMHLVTSMLVPSLEALLLRGITDYSCNASIAGYLRAARLMLMETPLIIPDITDSQALLDNTSKWCTSYEYSGTVRRSSRTPEPSADKHIVREVAECAAIVSQNIESSGLKVLPVLMSKPSATASKVLSSVSNTVTNSFNSICVATRAHMRDATTAVSTLQPFGIRKSPSECSQSVTLGSSVFEPLSEPVATPSAGDRLRASASNVDSVEEDPFKIKMSVAARSHSCQVGSCTGVCSSTSSAIMSSVCDAAVATALIPTDAIESSCYLKCAKDVLSREAVEQQITKASADIKTERISINGFETDMSAPAGPCRTTLPSSSDQDESQATGTAYSRPSNVTTGPCHSGKDEDKDETPEFKTLLLNSLPAGLLWTGLGEVLVHQLLAFLKHPHYSRRLAMHLLHLFCSHLLPHHR